MKKLDSYGEGEIMNEYRLSPHRFKELKHFCLQYNEIKDNLRTLNEIDLIKSKDSTSLLAIKRNEYSQAIKLIEMTAFESEKFLGGYILKSVSEDLSYTALNIPCSKYVFDYLREKYFWLLSERKGYS